MMNEQQAKEWWQNFLIGMVIGAFIGWQLWFSITLYKWVNRPSVQLHNYMKEIL